MFIISAGAGLGNQMFEYAFYMKMKSVYRNSVVKLDTQYAFPKAHNGWEVEKIFNLTSEKASLDEVKELADIDFVEYFGRTDSFITKIKRKLGIHKSSFIMQKDYTEYDEGFYSLDETLSYYLYGPFANSKYFSDIKEEIVNAFTFPEPDLSLKGIEKQIRETNSVSIHLRRGDYISQGVELLGVDYYNSAISRLEKIINVKRSELTFFIFSDDAEAARVLFSDLDNRYIITGNTGDNSYQDMQLMSMCNHNIISNSTFSFWGAYLNRNKNKVVVGTKKPFTGFKYPYTDDGWIMI